MREVKTKLYTFPELSKTARRVSWPDLSEGLRRAILNRLRAVMED